MTSPDSRRQFVKQSILGASALLAVPMVGQATTEFVDPDNLNIVGPQKGFSPHVGALSSMMAWMRDTVLNSVSGLSVKELDYIHDNDSNSIGAMLFHLAATERFYQINTFDGRSWGDWPNEDDKRFSLAMSLGNNARKKIKGNPLSFYLEVLEEVRTNTIAQFRKRDDDWLLAVDNNWGWGPTNNYCKWFHVCEHESNHNGQIKYIKKRIE